ncbi:MAG: hypothetical protein ACK5NK_07785 [Niabella sp.]
MKHERLFLKPYSNTSMMKNFVPHNVLVYKNTAILKSAVAYSAFVLFLVIGLSVSAQVKTQALDFGFPPNTIGEAVDLLSKYDTSKREIKFLYSNHYMFNNKGQLTEHSDTLSKLLSSKDIYKYDSFGKIATIEYGVSEFGFLNINNKINRFSKTNHGDTAIYTKSINDTIVEKIIEIQRRNGVLVSKTFYDAKNNKTQNIIYGKKGYSIKKYKNDLFVSETTYFNNKKGKVEKEILFTEPLAKISNEQWTTYEYNDQGDVIRKLVYEKNKPEETPKLKSTEYREYLYEGEYWVASMYYTIEKNKDTEFYVKTRRFITTQNKYALKEDQQKKFYTQVYQNYLNLIK